jgi:ADP-ribose pyrophosphatase YjhB (NUDIX family)
MDNLNPLQMNILRELLFKPKSRFTTLNKDKLPSDHFSYHLRILKDMGLIKIADSAYELTVSGKEYANRMDTDNKVIERQPKISVLIIPVKNLKDKEVFLINTRLKEPYYGYKGFTTGKIRYGETIEEAAARELKEETNLTAKFKHMFLLHEMVYDLDGNILEDKFFNVIEASNLKGILKDEEGSHNEWMTEEEFYSASPKYHDEESIFEWYKSKDFSFKEFKYYIEKF